MNLFYSEQSGMSIEKLWNNAGDAYINISIPTGEGEAELEISEIDKMIAALEFAKNDRILGDTKRLVAQLYDLDVNSIIGINIFDIDNNVRGAVEIEEDGQIRDIEFKIPRLV